MTNAVRHLPFAVLFAVAGVAGNAAADPLVIYAPQSAHQQRAYDQRAYQPRMAYAPDTERDMIDRAPMEADDDHVLPAHLQRQVVSYQSREPAGTIVIDTAHTYLYLVLGNGRAMRYGIGVGREGFTWAGTERVSRMAEWPDWHPPAEMIARQPYLPRFMAGGPGNPLGARALYLGSTMYRIHGTNDPTTIGRNVSSGCIRLTNADISDLYSRVGIGAKVVVLRGGATAQRAPREFSSTTMQAASSQMQQPGGGRVH